MLEVTVNIDTLYLNPWCWDGSEPPQLGLELHFVGYRLGLATKFSVHF